ncbi:MAG: CBS domain-containing protein [Myxococcales bacterium]
MTRSVRSVLSDSSIKDVAIVMTGDVTSLVPVVDASERLVGLVTERDIVIRACAGDKSIEDMRAADAMTAAPTVVGANQLLRDAVAAMTRLQVQRLPVVDDDFRVVGMISLGDIAKRADSGIDLRAALAAVSSRKLIWSRGWR